MNRCCKKKVGQIRNIYVSCIKAPKNKLLAAGIEPAIAALRIRYKCSALPLGHTSFVMFCPQYGTITIIFKSCHNLLVFVYMYLSLNFPRLKSTELFNKNIRVIKL